VVSPRARGLSIGVNMNPDQWCDYDCVYCEVNRAHRNPEAKLDVKVMATELEQTLAEVRSPEWIAQSCYRNLPAELRQLKHVTLSGDGEPTFSPVFLEAVETVVHLRALQLGPFFKLVLITNGTGLELGPVQAGLKFFTSQDEVWVKLDGGTEGYLGRVNRPSVPLEKVLQNILLVGRQRPVVIQSLFPAIHGEEPGLAEIDAYAARLKGLKEQGAHISLVQIYSATRPTPHSECGHLPLRTLSRIAQTVRSVTGLRAEVF